MGSILLSWPWSSAVPSSRPHKPGVSCTKSVPNRRHFQWRSTTPTWVFLCAKLLKELKFQSRTGGLDHVRDVGVAGSSCHPDQSNRVRVSALCASWSTAAVLGESSRKSVGRIRKDWPRQGTATASHTARAHAGRAGQLAIMGKNVRVRSGLLTSKLKPGGLLALYPQSLGYRRLRPIIEAAMAAGTLEHREDYKSLQILQVRNQAS